MFFLLVLAAVAGGHLQDLCRIATKQTKTTTMVIVFTRRSPLGLKIVSVETHSVGLIFPENSVGENAPGFIMFFVHVE